MSYDVQLAACPTSTHRSALISAVGITNYMYVVDRVFTKKHDVRGLDCHLVCAYFSLVMMTS